ncbi:winged helix-turn-helix transcriptional regulator [Saccharopolyspora erythraea]|uniref:metalloregulator ArsR/SmtB family transcription factor n=1 Tax=Saccharopolyspora erythraea TaxID=1836 RepID=UPI001BA540A5|nr:metalloregulator ArsR/SmtB family transcription factor [Saccharopolyspora erythraea]QUH02815.1 winged helix-turn-helix transcriptional regulator [Saccharopolyspora erythraea]
MDEVAAAIADPVRREILLLLRDNDLTAGQIAAHLPISRPAISRHVRVLRDSGLVRDQPTGRTRVYTLQTAPLTEIAHWIARFDTTADWQPRTGRPLPDFDDYDPAQKPRFEQLR